MRSGPSPTGKTARTPSTGPRLFRRWALPLATAAVGLAALALAMAWPAPRGPVLALFPPGTSAGEMLTAVRHAGTPVIAQPAGRPAVVVRTRSRRQQRALRSAGAWMVLDAKAGFGCAGALARAVMGPTAPSTR